MINKENQQMIRKNGNKEALKKNTENCKLLEVINMKPIEKIGKFSLINKRVSKIKLF